MRLEIPVDFDGPLGIPELAARQGVRPVEGLESILGPIHSRDDSVDDFLLLLRELRRENPGGSTK